MTLIQNETYLTYSEAALFLNIKISTLYGWVHQDLIPHLRLGRRTVRFSKEELHSWVAARARGSILGCNDQLKAKTNG